MIGCFDSVDTEQEEEIDFWWHTYYVDTLRVCRPERALEWDLRRLRRVFIKILNDSYVRNKDELLWSGASLQYYDFKSLSKFQVSEFSLPLLMLITSRGGILFLVMLITTDLCWIFFSFSLLCQRISFKVCSFVFN